MCVYFQLKHNYYCTKYYCSIHEENSLNYHRHICGSFRYKPNIILLHISIVWKLWYRLWGWCAVCKCVKYSLYSVYMSPVSNRRFALQHFLTQKYNWNTQWNNVRFSTRDYNFSICLFLCTDFSTEICWPLFPLVSSGTCTLLRACMYSTLVS